jgi:hypothetical protein
VLQHVSFSGDRHVLSLDTLLQRLHWEINIAFWCMLLAIVIAFSVSSYLMSERREPVTWQPPTPKYLLKIMDTANVGPP